MKINAYYIRVILDLHWWAWIWFLDDNCSKGTKLLVFDPCITHLASLLSWAISCSTKWLFDLKFLALAVWMRNRRTDHHTTVAFGKFWSRIARWHAAWICSSVTWLQLWQEKWVTSLHIVHFFSTSSSVPHFLQESNLIAYCMFFFNLNSMKIRWN